MRAAARGARGERSGMLAAKTDRSLLIVHADQRSMHSVLGSLLPFRRPLSPTCAKVPLRGVVAWGILFDLRAQVGMSSCEMRGIMWSALSIASNPLALFLKSHCTMQVLAVLEPNHN